MPSQCVIKIDPATMTEVDRWTGGPGSVLSLSFDPLVAGIIAGLNTPDIVRIDTPTMTELNRWTGTAGEIPQTLVRNLAGG